MRLTRSRLDRSCPRRRGRHSAVAAVSAVVIAVVVVSMLGAVCAAPAAVAVTTEVVAVAGSVGQVLDNIRTWLMGVLAGLATVFLTIGGVRYLVGGGDPGEVQKAKTAFKSAGIGYALAALAPLVVTVLKGIVGA